MKLLTRKDKNNSSGLSYYFGDFGEVDTGISIIRSDSNTDIYKDTEHFHKSSNEYYIVINGEVSVSIEKKVIILNETRSLMVEAGEKHYISSINKYPCLLIVVSSKKYIGDKIIIK